MDDSLYVLEEEAGMDGWGEKSLHASSVKETEGAESYLMSFWFRYQPGGFCCVLDQ